MLRFPTALVAGLTLVYAAAWALPAVPNASFESGGQSPDGWTASGDTAWASDGAADGQRHVTVRDGGQWKSDPLALEPGEVYELRVRLRLRANGDAVPYAVIGPDFAIRVLALTVEEGQSRWQEQRLRFVAPDTARTGPVRLALGQWQLKGEIDYDLAELYPVKLSHRQQGPIELGEGESLTGHSYRFAAPLDTWRTVSRPLAGFSADFHDNRWRFARAGQYVIYRHAVGDRRQARATIRPTVWFHEPSSLRLRVEASTEGHSYRVLGEVGQGMPGPGFALPPDMLPAPAVWVRLSCDDSDQTQPTFFQVTGYEYEAEVEVPETDLAGQTTALTVLGEDAVLAIAPEGRTGDQPTIGIQVTNRGDRPVALQPQLLVEDPRGETTTVTGAADSLSPGAQTRVGLPYETPLPGRYFLELTLGPGLNTRLATDGNVCVLDVSNYGEALPSPDPQVGVWWAAAGWKVSRNRPLPTTPGSAVVVRLAANEVEGAQIVVRPDRPLRGLKGEVGALRSGSGATLPASAAELLAVDYVNVEYASDEIGRTGLWPDPLPPLGGGRDVPAGCNQPLWLSVKAPPDARPGLYSGEVTLTAEGFQAVVPVQVEVFAFALPPDSTCKTMFGWSPGNVRRYHNLRTEAEQRTVLDKYLGSFADHRISPYNPAPLDGFTYQWKTGSRWDGGRIVTDNPHAGGAALLSEDSSTTASPQAAYTEPVSVGTAPLKLSLWYRTEASEGAMVVLSHLDAAGAHIQNHNKHAVLPASGEWRQAEFTFADPPPATRSARLSMLGCQWTPEGEKTGAVWLDDVSLVDTATGKELIEDGGFENARPVAGTDLVKFEWAKWDAAMERAVKDYRFNTFIFSVPGLGGGTFHERYPGELCGYKEDTPEYAALLKAWCDEARAHLQERGILDRAVVYPFDEPDVKDYPFVISQLHRLKDDFPGLRRMVPMNLGAADEFVGLIDLWCPIMHSHRPQFATERQQAGDIYTWYICCGPKAPYIANFIDRPGTDLRVWFWQTWQERVDGVLLWESTWWTSGAAYPDTPQNPYSDAMSWVDGYGTPRGEKRRWNCGDGRFLYPPQAATGMQPETVLDGPVTSLRWEALRDGVEDYEYLALLKRLLTEKRERLTPDEAARYEALLRVPEDISASLVSYTQDPTPLLARRLEIARAIEALSAR